MKKEYSLPTKQEYLQPGGHPRCMVYIVDKYNNIYPDIKWAERKYQHEQMLLDEHNKDKEQFVLFI